MSDKESKAPTETKTPPPTETKPADLDALTASGAFSERGINIVNMAPGVGPVPEPAGLPAASGKPAAQPAQPASPPSEPAPKGA